MSRAERFVAVFGALCCLLMGSAALSCGGDDDAAAEGGGSNSAKNIAKVAMALTSGVDFEDGKVVAALLPDPSNDTVTLDQSSTTLSLEPGGAEILPLEITNPESSDTQVEAVLLQFEDADDHIEVAVDGSEDEMETFELGFTVGTDICDALCNEVVQLKLLQAVRMSDKSVSKRLERTLELDCSDDGDPDACETKKPVKEPTGSTDDPDAGTSSGGGGGPNTNNRANNFATALIAANSAACSGCAQFGMAACDALYPRDSLECIKTAITAADDGESATAVSALQSTLTAARAACASCDSVMCPTSLLADHLADLPMALADDILACTGPLPPEPPAM